MRKAIFRLSVLLIFFSSSLIIYAQRKVPVPNAPYHVSIIKLLANPDFYHGKKVTIMGYFHYKFEDSALYFTKDHADRLMSFDAIWIRYKPGLSDSLKINLNDLDEKYVGIMGIFNKDEFGHMGSYAGVIENTTAIWELVDFSQKSRRYYKKMGIRLPSRKND